MLRHCSYTLHVRVTLKTSANLLQLKLLQFFIFIFILFAVRTPASERMESFWEELDKEITEGMEIRFVTEMAEVIEQAFVKE